MLCEEDVEMLKEMLRNDAPRDTGNLALHGISSFQVGFQKNDNQKWVIVIGGPNAPYAPFVKKKGTHNQELNLWYMETIDKWTLWMIQKYQNGGML
jgi:hypothetical protein